MRVEEHFDLDLERAILSSCIYSEDAYNSIEDKISPTDFVLKAHQDIFNAIASCVKANEPMGLSFIKKHKKIDENVLNEVLATTAIVDVPKYAQELKEKSIKRRLLDLAHTMPARISENKSIEDITDDLGKEIFNLTSTANTHNIKDMPTVMGELLAEFKKLKENEHKGIVGLDTGFNELNYKIKGFKNGELIIIAARPGMGKTSMGLNFVEKTLRENKGVVLFSLEMPAVQIMQRLLSAKTSIPLQRILSADLNDDEWGRISDACEEYTKTKLFIYDSGYASITDIRAILRRQKQNPSNDIALCVIDYIGLMTSQSNFSERHLQVSEISRGLKLLARELEIPIIALSQLNRALESRTNKRPMLSDLRESGAIEQDADTILFVYRDDVYREQEEKEKESKAKADGKEHKRTFFPNPREEKAELIIGKNRNGPMGVVDLVFLKENSHFIEAPKENFKATNFEE